MKVLAYLRHIFSLPDLRKRILITLFIFLIFRILAQIPLPGVDLAGLQQFFETNQVLGFLNLFSGGSIGRFSLVMLGVGPYITSSIVFQLLTVVVPSFEALSKEGEYGRQKLNQYTRFATVPIGFIEAYGLMRLLKSQGVVIELDPFVTILTLISATAGTIILMWLGEIISEKGIGNGISLLIALGIVAGIPVQVQATLRMLEATNIFNLLAFGVIALLAIVFIIWMTEGERRLSVAYARRIVGRRTVGGVETYLPVKVNTAGVIPIIFAASVMIFPGVVGQFLTAARSEWLSDFGTRLSNIFTHDLYYGIAFFVLVVLFTFFYTSVIFKPNQVAENLQKQGGFIPGFRPGRETSFYLSFVINRVTLIGSIFLATVAVLPFIVQSVTNIRTLAIGGTGVLIIVSVVIETMRQIQAHLATRTYEEFA